MNSMALAQGHSNTNRNTMRFQVIRSMILFLLFSFYALPMTYGSISNLEKHESIIFFPTLGNLDRSINSWRIPIHGWVFEPVNSRVRKSALLKLLEKSVSIDLSTDQKARFNKRIDPFLVDNERGKSIVIELLNEKFSLNQSKANGHFLDEVIIAQNSLNPQQQVDGIEFKAVLPGSDARIITGSVRFNAPDALFIISDIDDTVKISEVADKRKLLLNTFCNEFIAVEGMPSLFRYWESEYRATIHFVSSNPWHLYPSIKQFTAINNFPQPVFHLKYFRIKDRTLLNLLKKGPKTKPKTIESIIRRNPNGNYILIGDSGEEDPEVYAEIYRHYSKAIVKILIRDVSGLKHVSDPRMQAVFKDVPTSKWQLFDSPLEIKQ